MILVAALVICGGLVESSLTYVNKDPETMSWGPMACGTKDFKHDRYDGERFDMEAQIEAKTVIIEEAT